MNGYERWKQWRSDHIVLGSMKVWMCASYLIDTVCGSGVPWTLKSYVAAMVAAYDAHGVTCDTDVARAYCLHVIPSDYIRANVTR